MISRSFDVIIIGGGLAGLSLAIQLAEAGRNIVLLEKNKYPFHRVCGEYISLESWDFLNRIGVPLNQLALPGITELHVSSVNGNCLIHSLDPGGFGISRFMLDNTLAEIAKNKGAEIIEECRADSIHEDGNSFIVSTQKENFQGKVVIGAFGKRSNIDKKMERSFASAARPVTKNWVGVKYHIRSNSPDHVIELHNFTGGYCGVSKVEGDRYCLCYLTKAENLRKFNGSIHQMEEKLLSQNPFLKNYFSDRGNFLFESPETIAQINFENKLPVEKHVIMLGDAAGMIAPLCGNGMSMALHASAISFPLIEKFLDRVIGREQMENEYAKQWKRLFAFRVKAGRMLQPLLVKSSLSKPAIAALKYFPFVMRKIVSATHGKSF